MDKFKKFLSVIPTYSTETKNEVLELANLVLDKNIKYFHSAREGVIVHYKQKNEKIPEVLIDLIAYTGSHLIPPFLSEKYDIRTGDGIIYD